MANIGVYHFSEIDFNIKIQVFQSTVNLCRSQSTLLHRRKGFEERKSLDVVQTDKGRQTWVTYFNQFARKDLYV